MSSQALKLMIAQNLDEKNKFNMEKDHFQYWQRLCAGPRPQATSSYVYSHAH